MTFVYNFMVCFLSPKFTINLPTGGWDIEIALEKACATCYNDYVFDFN